MEESYQHHVRLCRIIDDSVCRFGRCVLFGPSALKLFDERYGDVSIIIFGRNRSDPKPVEQRAILEKLRLKRGSLFTNTWLDASRNNLRVIVVNPIRNERLTIRRADITTDLYLVYVWIVIKVYMFKNAWLFPVLRLLCSWIVYTGLVGGRRSLLPNYFVPLLFIDHCLKRGVIKSVILKPLENRWAEFVHDPEEHWVFGNEKEWRDLIAKLKDEKDSIKDWENGVHGRIGELLCSFMRNSDTLESTMHSNLVEVQIFCFCESYFGFRF